jgi:hypothetical protein
MADLPSLAGVFPMLFSRWSKVVLVVRLFCFFLAVRLSWSSVAAGNPQQPRQSQFINLSSV